MIAEYKTARNGRLIKTFVQKLYPLPLFYHNRLGFGGEARTCRRLLPMGQYRTISHVQVPLIRYFCYNQHTQTRALGIKPSARIESAG